MEHHAPSLHNSCALHMISYNNIQHHHMEVSLIQRSVALASLFEHFSRICIYSSISCFCSHNVKNMSQIHIFPRVNKLWDATEANERMFEDAASPCQETSFKAAFSLLLVVIVLLLASIADFQWTQKFREPPSVFGGSQNDSSAS